MKKTFSLLSIMFLLVSCAKEPAEVPKSTTPVFTGNWTVAEDSKDYGTSTYNLTIIDSSNTSYILMAYLYSFNKKTYASINGSNFSITKQLIQGSNISGSGNLVNANRINLTYYVQSTTTHFDTVTAVLTK